MAYNSTAFGDAKAIARTPDDFRRDERIVVLMGGAALGLLAGLTGALALGRVGIWPVAFGAPLFLFALYLSVATVHDALKRRTFGSAVAASIVLVSMLTWPLAALVLPTSALLFWAAPTAALSSMVLLALCGSGAQNAVYRVCGQAGVVCAAIGYLGVTQIMS